MIVELLLKFYPLFMVVLFTVSFFLSKALLKVLFGTNYRVKVATGENKEVEVRVTARSKEDAIKKAIKKMA